MKKIQISLSAIALVLGLGFAMANNSHAKAANSNMTQSWFTYNGSGSVTDAANYTETSGDPECSGATNVCAIQATVGSGSKPVITSSLATEINNAVSSHNPSANVSLQD